MLAGAAKRNKESISFAENCITEHNAEGHEFPLRKYTYFCPKTVKGGVSQKWAKNSIFGIYA